MTPAPTPQHAHDHGSAGFCGNHGQPGPVAVIPFPAGPFAVVVADPPWMYQKRPGAKTGGVGPSGTVERVYPTMTNEEIAHLPVKDIVADDAHLFLWVTNPGMFGNRFSDIDPEDIARAWGFEYRTLITWVKTTALGAPMRGGMGWYFRGCTEHVLYATRGRAAIPAALREPNIVLAPRTGHSSKPPAFLDLVERVASGPFLELFARQTRLGWDSWGNEVSTKEVTP